MAKELKKIDTYVFADVNQVAERHPNMEYSDERDGILDALRDNCRLRGEMIDEQTREIVDLKDRLFNLENENAELKAEIERNIP